MPTQSFSTVMSGDEYGISAQPEHVYARQVEQLYSQAPIGMVASLVNAAILAGIQWDVVSNQHLLIWLGCVLAINVIGGMLTYQYRQLDKTRIQAEVWGSHFLARSIGSGMVWGAFPVLLYPHDSIPHQIFLGLILGGMVAGATAVFAAPRKSFLRIACYRLFQLLSDSYLKGVTFISRWVWSGSYFW